MPAHGWSERPATSSGAPCALLRLVPQKHAPKNIELEKFTRVRAQKRTIPQCQHLGETRRPPGTETGGGENREGEGGEKRELAILDTITMCRAPATGAPSARIKNLRVPYRHRRLANGRERSCLTRAQGERRTKRDRQLKNDEATQKLLLDRIQEVCS